MPVYARWHPRRRVQDFQVSPGVCSAQEIVTTLLHTGLRVGELVDLVWERVTLGEWSGWVEVVGKRQRRRRNTRGAHHRFHGCPR